MLTKEENELLTQVGPGTPCGELLRRYWQPVGYVRDFTPQQPIKRVKVMHEELVVFRTPEGTYGCLGEHCSHRGASLAYGFLEAEGLRCPYHGWKYAPSGQCLEQPFEPHGSTYKERIQHPAYPVQTTAGIVFIYMGPRPAPLLPRWDVLVWDDGERILHRWEPLNCNWVQAEENSADITHTYFLHGHMLQQRGLNGRAVDYYHRPIEQYGFQLFEWGLLKSWRYGRGEVLGPERVGGNPLIFPNMLRIIGQSAGMHQMHWRVPIDDTHTQIYSIQVFRGKPQAREDWETPPVAGMAPQRTPDGGYTLDNFPSHDTMAWETQGALYDRSTEHLGASDRGIVLFRKLLREQIAVVQTGGDPLGVIRDADKNRFIELPAWVAEEEDEVIAAHAGGVPTAGSMAAVFDERHEVFLVPPGAARPVDR